MSHDSYDIDRMVAELTAAGWTAVTPTRWRAPNGALFIGPAGAWRAMQVESTDWQRRAMKAEHERDELIVALRHIAHVAEGHHHEQPSHVLLHSLTVDIPDMVRVALEAQRETP